MALKKSKPTVKQNKQKQWENPRKSFKTGKLKAMVEEQSLQDIVD